MITMTHHFSNMGFKSKFSSKHKEQIISKNKEGFELARLMKMEFESFALSGGSLQGVVLFPSMQSRKTGYSVICVNDAKITDFLFFGKMVILKTDKKLFGYDWVREEMVFQKDIYKESKIHLIEPSLIIESTFENKNHILNPYNANESIDSFEGLFIDGYYESEFEKVVLMYCGKGLDKFTMGFYDVMSHSFTSTLEIPMFDLMKQIKTKLDVNDYYVSEKLHEVIRIIGLSYEQDSFYFSFCNFLVLVKMKEKKYQVLYEVDRNLNVIKVIPRLNLFGIGVYYDYLILSDDTYSNYTRYSGRILYEDELSEDDYDIVDVHHSSFLADVNELEARNLFFKERNIISQTLISPEVYVETKNGVKEYSYGFKRSDFLDKQIFYRQYMSFFSDREFSFQKVKNTRFIQAPINFPLESEETVIKELEYTEQVKEQEISLQPKEEVLSQTKQDILSIYRTPLIKDEDKEIIRKLVSQEDWVSASCRPEREMITSVLPSLILNYDKEEDAVYKQGIEEIMQLIRSIYKNKKKAKSEKHALDVKYATEYAKSLL